METAVRDMMLTDKYHGDIISVDTEVEHRCDTCKRMLFWGIVDTDRIEVKCSKCRSIYGSTKGCQRVKEYRCQACGKLVFKGELAGASVKVPCPRCKAASKFEDI